jgi:hypothetical protein
VPLIACFFKIIYSFSITSIASSKDSILHLLVWCGLEIQFDLLVFCGCLIGGILFVFVVGWPNNPLHHQ